ncbi:MAG TPA: ABC transporter substrate-binding protein [Candidatus Limnocylindria bacterium]|jgi:peptide/nickel transport system substrate-binding protein
MRRASVLALAFLFGVACQVPPASATPAPTGAQQGGTLRVALPAEVTAFDPWNADPASLMATRQIFETLVEIDPATSRITPGLASSWQMTNDGASWTFTLREGVLFHDSVAFDAASVVASFERGRTGRGAAYRALFDNPPAIVNVVAVDPRTVRFDLRTPFGPFLAHLAAPQTAIARANGAGTGPFTASAGALAPDGTLTLGRNEFYWRRDAAGKQLPYLDGLVLRPVRDPTSRLAELRAGRVDAALDLPVAQASSARSDPSLVVSPRKDAALASLGIDAITAPFDRPEVRRAVAMAVNRNALSAVYAGTSRPATQVVPPGVLGYDESVVEFAPLDTDAARKALADAHVTTPIAADLAYPNTPTAAYPDPQRIAQSIAADLSKIGIVARLRAVDPTALADAKATFTLDTTPIGLDPDDVFWPLYGLNDPSGASLIVGLVKKARAEADPSKRAELYKQVSKIARTDALRVPLLFADRPNAVTARLVGYTGIEYFGTVWLRP